MTVKDVLANKWDDALINFLQTTNLASDFVDAYASLGTYWILKKASEGVLEAFNKATEINQGFASIYAFQLVALGSMEKRPGTTLEFHQQYKEMLN